MKSDVIDIDGAIDAKTDKAVLFHDGDKSKAVWLARSQIEVSETGFSGIVTVPPRAGGWVKSGKGWTCCVEQGQYGHYARKPTLLYAVNTDLPELRWGKTEAVFPQWALDRYGLAYCKRAGELAFKGGGKDNKHRIGTPPEFRDLLLAIARSVPS